MKQFFARGVYKRMTDQTHTEEAAQTNNEQQPDAAAQDGAAAETSATELEQLQARIQQLEQESATNKDAYLRAAADLKNFKRRAEEERGNLVRNASAGVIMKLLPVLDDFDLAMQHAPAEVAQSSWFNGVQGIQRKLQLILETEGVKPIEAEGQPFDPHVHEAVMHEDAGPENSGKVTADLRRGYTLHDRVLRPSMVKVGQ
jgi:molecular chaperone GrpE